MAEIDVEGAFRNAELLGNLGHTQLPFPIEGFRRQGRGGGLLGEAPGTPAAAAPGAGGG
jgi:hypothetical protein